MDMEGSKISSRLLLHNAEIGKAISIYCSYEMQQVELLRLTSTSIVVVRIQCVLLSV